MKLFVTGGSGFVGRRLLARINPTHYERITCLARGELSLPQPLIDAGNVAVVTGNLGDASTLAAALDEETVILHLAALTGKADPQAYYEVNTQGTQHLIDVARAANVRGLCYVSTIAVAFEDTRGYHYAHSKQAAEASVASSGLPFTIVRPTIVLGSGSPVGEKLHGLARRSPLLIPGPGRARIQPIDVDDLAKLLLELIESRRFEGETLDLGGPEALSVEAYLRRAHEKQAGKPARIALHLPIQLALPVLRLLERLIGGLLPVSAGQFASFFNDGVARDNAVLVHHRASMKGIDAMLNDLTANGAPDGG